MLSTAEFKPGWSPIFTLCLILAASLMTAKAQAIPPGQYIPSINASVEGVAFFESARGMVPSKDRIFRSEFPRSQARFINWELRLKHPRPGRKVNFRIQARYYGPSGKLLVEHGTDTYLEPNWYTSNHAFGWGNDQPGTWAPGTYRVDLFIANAKVASATFRIISGKGQSTTQKKRPDPRTDLPPDLEGL